MKSDAETWNVNISVHPETVKTAMKMASQKSYELRRLVQRRNFCLSTKQKTNKLAVKKKVQNKFKITSIKLGEISWNKFLSNL